MCAEEVGAGSDDRPFDLAAEYEEMGVPRPDERLSEAFPDEFATYCEHFIDVFPRSPYYVKTTYDPHSRYAGWPEKKSRKTKRPLPLIDNGKFLNRTECVERHLDYEQWLLFKDTTDPFRDHKFGDFFWLGQGQPKKTTFNAIDFDNKRFLGYYRLGSNSSAQVMPVVHMPLEHFKAMKRIYDAFPDRIWCITSETLGLDIIQRHSLDTTTTVHTRIKRQLARIGLDQTEVHPMSGRCKRRPFGEHYRTITEDGLLEPWQRQLAFYLNPGRTPSFERICRTLLQAVKDQWSSWLTFSPHAERSDRQTVIKKHKHELSEVVHWLRDGCPLTKRVQLAVVDTASAAAADNRQPPTVNLHRESHYSLPSLRDGKWPLALEQLAFHGLPCEDSIGDVAYEMAKFLWWVELYEIPEEQRASESLRLLQHFVNNKHNGMISRWNAGRKQLVHKQLHRCLRLAQDLDDNDSFELFQRIRTKRQGGKYRTVISLADAIHSDPTSDDDNSRTEPVLPDTPSSPWSTYFSVGSLEALNAEIIEQFRVMSEDGYPGCPSDAAEEIVDFIEAHSDEKQLSMRLLTPAIRIYKFCIENGSDWKPVVLAQMQNLSRPVSATKRLDNHERDTRLIRESLRQFPDSTKDACQHFMDRTSKSRASFYRAFSRFKKEHGE